MCSDTIEPYMTSGFLYKKDAQIIRVAIFTQYTNEPLIILLKPYIIIYLNNTLSLIFLEVTESFVTYFGFSIP
jgi:hypothetical protein